MDSIPVVWNTSHISSVRKPVISIHCVSMVVYLYASVLIVDVEPKVSVVVTVGETTGTTFSSTELTWTPLTLFETPSLKPRVVKPVIPYEGRLHLE